MSCWGTVRPDRNRNLLLRQSHDAAGLPPLRQQASYAILLKMAVQAAEKDGIVSIFQPGEVSLRPQWFSSREAGGFYHNAPLC